MSLPDQMTDRWQDEEADFAHGHRIRNFTAAKFPASDTFRIVLIGWRGHTSR